MLALLRRLLRRGSWPVPVPRPEGFSIQGECWTEQVPEPMENSRAERALKHRRDVFDEMRWQERVRAEYEGRAAGRRMSTVEHLLARARK